MEWTANCPQPAFSAALLAYVEVHCDDDAQKNALCAPVPFPGRTKDYARIDLSTLRYEGVWSREPDLRAWIRNSRLEGFGKIVDEVLRDDAEKMAVLGRVQAAAVLAARNLRRLMG